MIARIISIFFLITNGYSVWAQIDTILWQDCLGTEDGRNWSYAAENTDNGYLFGINLDADGLGVTGYHGKGDAWIINTDKFGNVLWNKCYGGSNGDGSHKIIKIDENSFYLLNSSWSHDGDVQNGRDGNFWVVKIGPEGNILWENSYGGSLNGEEVRDAILMPDKGLIMMGRIRSIGGDVTTHYGDMDVWLCRIDSLGNILWQKTIGNEGKDNGLKVKLTSRNTILFVGGHDLPGGMIECPDLGYDILFDVWLVEMNLKGDILNQWCYGGKYHDLGYDIIELEDGYVITASTRSNDRDVSGFHGTPGVYANDDIWCFKIDFFGNIIWQKCLGGYSWEDPIYLTEVKDGGIIIIGMTNSSDGDVTGNHTPEGGLDIWVVKLTSDGQLLWEHCFGSSHNNRFWGINSVAKVDDYDYVIGANSEVADGDVTCDLFPNSGTSNAWLFEIKDCSYYLPSQPVVKSGPDTLCTVANPESIYSIDSVQWATGYEWSIEPENAGTIMSNDTTAQITWDPQFEGTVEIKARSQNDCGNSAWSEAFITHVYTCLGTGDYIINANSLIIKPNPADDKVTVSIKGEIRKEQMEISFLNILGNEIKRGLLSEGEESTVIDISVLPAGIYFVAIMDEGKRVTSGKMVVAR